MARSGRHIDVLVVGAGLAGLTCALDAATAGLTVQVLEAGTAPGGRMRTDLRDGFRLDRGFQVFNTDYPQVRRRIDTGRLSLHPFTPGFMLATPRGRVRIVNPLRAPRLLAEMRPTRLGGARDLAALSALCASDLVTPPRRIKQASDLPMGRALAKAGLSGGFVDEVLRPFFAGVFLDRDLETSSRVFHLVWRSMLRGRLTLPGEGIGVVPAQLARRLPPGALRFETPVRGLTDEGVVLADGTEAAARAVVVATGARSAAELVPQVSAPAMRSVTTYYHTTPYAPLDEPTLLVDGSMRVLNTVVLSAVCPGYAPRGQALVSTSVLGAADAPGEDVVRRDLAEVYRTDTANWSLVGEYRIEDALPAMPSPWPLIRTSRVIAGQDATDQGSYDQDPYAQDPYNQASDGTAAAGPGAADQARRYVCGDHRATGSVQGAMASGTRAARELVADLARGR
jgi:phytoene dehydrogenase-like protein